MRTILIVFLPVLLASCAHPNGDAAFQAVGPSKDGAPNTFWFNKDPQSPCWHSSYLNYEQIVKAYARRESLSFDFSTAGVMLSFEVDEKTGSLFAHIMFDHGVGKQGLWVDIDQWGKVLRHGLVHDES